MPAPDFGPGTILPALRHALFARNFEKGCVPSRRTLDIPHVNRDDRSEFSKKIEREMEEVGSNAAQGIIRVAVIVRGVLALGVIFGIRQSIVCPDCNGKGTSYDLFKSGTRGGNGYRK